MKYTIFTLLFLLTGCCEPFNERTERYNHAIRVRGRYATKAIQEGSIPFGFGVGVSGDVEILDLVFNKVGYYTLNEARIFIVNQAENFLHTINADREIRPHLHEYPATTKLIQLSFTFKTENGTDVPLPYILRASVSFGKVFYGVAAECPLGTETIHRETYEEALQWVKENAPEALWDVGR